MIANANSIRIPLADKSVQMCVTSPPYYGLRDYGLQGTEWGAVTYTPMAGLPSVTVAGCDPECEHVWGDEQTRTAQPQRDHGTDGGFGETRGKETWRDGSSGEIKTGAWCQRCGGWRGCLGLEPTPEMFVAHIVAVMREVWRVLRDDGTCWVNFGDSYAGSGKGGQSESKRSENWQPTYVNKGLTPANLKPKDLIGIPWRVAFALQADGWYLRNDIIWHKPNPMPESVTDRCTKAHEYLFLLAKSKRYYYDADAVKEKSDENSGWAKQRNNGINTWKYNNTAERIEQTGQRIESSTLGTKHTRNRRTVWTISTKPYKGAHFATFPTDLVRPCVLAGSSEKGVCPVCGSPWERLLSKGFSAHSGETDSLYEKGSSANRLALLRQAARKNGGEYSNTAKTIGWQPTCDHDAEPIPSKVLDPFCGSGTTGQVCRELGRKFVGLDLSTNYLRDFALIRAERKQTKASIQAMPLFSDT